MAKAWWWWWWWWPGGGVHVRLTLSRSHARAHVQHALRRVVTEDAFRDDDEVPERARAQFLGGDIGIAFRGMGGFALRNRI